MHTNLLSPLIDSKDKKSKQLLEVVKALSKSKEKTTIYDIADIIETSIPTATSMVSILIEEGWVVNQGKKENSFGRKPNVYSLNSDRCFSIGIIVGLESINLAVCNINLSITHQNDTDDFRLYNTPECLKELVSFIKSSIKAFGLTEDKLLGIGLAMTGRVNTHKGETYNYFNFMDKTLKSYLEDTFNTQVCVDNDTRVAGITEHEFGKSKKAKNALFVNMDRGLGLSILINGQLASGASGFSGEFGHMQFGKKNRLCICGKQGCLGTEVSGYAMQLDLEEALKNGAQSLFFDNQEAKYSFKNILAASNRGDSLSIQIIQEQGVKLGESLGNIINLLNPELIVIGGKIISAGEMFLDAVKLGLKKTSLVNILKECRVEMSELQPNDNVKGAASLVLKKLDLI